SRSSGADRRVRRKGVAPEGRICHGRRMTCFVSHTTIDCTDAYGLSTWWKGVLGYRDVPDDPNEPGHEECMILDPETGHRLLFIEVPDPTPGKNKVHLDVRPREGTM